MEIVTGFRNTAHVTAEQQGLMNAGLMGTSCYVLGTGNMLKSETISNNQIRIYDGDAVMYGRHVTLARDTHEDVTIQNGISGNNRNDLIVIRYTKETITGIEKAELVVIQGTTGTDAKDPSYNDGSILNGDTTVDMPLYRVKIEGISISAVESMFTVVASMAELQEKYDALNLSFTSLNSKWNTKEVTDFDNASTTGFYYVGSGAANTPNTNAAFAMIVIKVNGANIAQVAIGLNLSGMTYVRVRRNDTWQDWKLVSFS